MTNEEAIRIATGLRTDFKCESDTMVDFCNTVIKALKQEPCGDCISRQAVIDCFKKWQPYMATRILDFEEELSALPSVIPQPVRDDMEFPTIDKLAKDVVEAALDEIYGGKTIREWIEILVKQQPWEDCVSRQAAIALAKDIYVPTKDGTVYKHRCIDPDEIRELPPVTPRPKMGHWKDVESLDGALWNICSECGESQYFATNYCPNCGARMEEQE